MNKREPCLVFVARQVELQVGQSFSWTRRKTDNWWTLCDLVYLDSRRIWSPPQISPPPGIWRPAVWGSFCTTSRGQHSRTCRAASGESVYRYLLSRLDLGDQNNPEDCDGDVGGEKEIETDREKTVQQPSNQWRLQSKYQPSQHANVLQGEINL